MTDKITNNKKDSFASLHSAQNDTMLVYMGFVGKVVWRQRRQTTFPTKLEASNNCHSDA